MPIQKRVVSSTAFLLLSDRFCIQITSAYPNLFVVNNCDCIIIFTIGFILIKLESIIAKQKR